MRLGFQQAKLIIEKGKIMAYQSINPFTNQKLKDYPSHSDQDIQNALDTAEKICDRIGIIIKGKLVMTGTLDEIRSAKGDGSLEDIFIAVASENDKAEV